MKKTVLFTLLFLGLACPSFAATYFVSFGAGSDANNGTSSATPFKHIKGMTGCTSVCNSTSVTSGDTVKFKLGDTWTSSFPWAGIAGVTYTTDVTFGSGAKPIFDDGHASTDGSGNGMFNGASSETINGLKFINCGPVTTFNQIKCLFFENAHDVTITNSDFSTESWIGIFFVFDTAGSYSNFTFTGNDFTHNSGAIWFGSAQAGTTEHNVVYNSNTFHDYSTQLGGVPGNDIHGDGAFHFFTSSLSADNTEYIDGLVFCNNRFFGDFRRGYGTSGAMTAFWFAEGPASGTICNNDMSYTPVQASMFQGLIVVDGRNNSRASALGIYNNSMAAIGTNAMSANLDFFRMGASMTITAKNNILYAPQYGVFLEDTSSAAAYSADYNLINSSSAQLDYNSSLKSYSQWQALGLDVHSILGGNPSYAAAPGDETIGATSSVYHTGTNLTSLGVTILNTSLNGVSRSSTTAWTMGAYDAPPGHVYYASNTGTGTTCTTGTPGSPVECMGIAAPNDTVVLKKGSGTPTSPAVYTGTNYMIAPPGHNSGTAGQYITVQAETDGAVMIDGEGARPPLFFDHNQYWIVQGMNIGNSNADVAEIFTGSDSNIFRRICAFNANPNGNTHVWSIFQANGNLLEDVCAFGTGRKDYESYETSGLTIRRPFGMWNSQQDDAGPFIVYSLSYNSDHVIIDNPIGTRDEDADSNPDGLSDQGIFSMDRLNEYNDCEIHSGYYGGIGFILGTQNILQDDNHAGWMHGGGVFGSLTFQDMVLYATPGTHRTQQRIQMTQYHVTGDGFGDNGCASTTLTANRIFKNITVIGTNDGVTIPRNVDILDTPTPNDGWTSTNFQEANSVAAIYSGANTLYSNNGTSHGATVNFQYKDGILTTTPLWPWPMNQRIKDALVYAGRPALDVDATIFGIFGTPDSVAPAGSAPIDNFDSYTSATDLNGQGGWVYGENGAMTVETAIGDGQGGKSVRSSAGAGDNTYYYLPFTSVASDTFAWEMRSSIDTTIDSPYYGISLHEAGVSKRTDVHFGSNHNIELFDGLTSTWKTICPFVINKTYRIYEHTDAVGHAGQAQYKCGYNGTYTAWFQAIGTMTVVNLMQINDMPTVAHTLRIDAVGSITDIISISASTGIQGTTKSLNIVGFNTNWIQGQTIASFSGTGITVNSTTINSTTTATVSITISSSATASTRDFFMTNATTEEGENDDQSFTVMVPSISTVNPSSANQGTSLTLTLVGVNTGWINGTTVGSISGANVTVNSTSVSSPTALTLNVTVGGSAALTARDVTTTTGSEVEVKTSAFTPLSAITTGKGALGLRR